MINAFYRSNIYSPYTLIHVLLSLRGQGLIKIRGSQCLVRGTHGLCPDFSFKVCILMYNLDGLRKIKEVYSCDIAGCSVLFQSTLGGSTGSGKSKMLWCAAVQLTHPLEQHLSSLAHSPDLLHTDNFTYFHTH